MNPKLNAKVNPKSQSEAGYNCECLKLEAKVNLKLDAKVNS